MKTNVIENLKYKRELETIFYLIEKGSCLKLLFYFETFFVPCISFGALHGHIPYRDPYQIQNITLFSL